MVGDGAEGVLAKQALAAAIGLFVSREVKRWPIVETCK